MPMGKLTARKVETLTEPGHYVDGEGLALVIGRRGGKSWILRTVVRGRRRDIGLGGTSWVSLAEAREKARALRKVAREGGDPIAARRAATACPTFEDAARQVHAEQILSHGKNEKHRAQWINSLRDHAFPVLGGMRVSDIEQADVLRVLTPIWTEKPETARRVRQRIRTILDWARTAGFHAGVNPVEGVEKGLARQRMTPRHHPAMDWRAVPAFVADLPDGVTADALRFLILTASRTGEVIGARWSEIDVAGRLWTVPAARMKAAREHRVPLPQAALEVLARMRGLDADLVFPGRRRGRGLSNMAMAQFLKRLGHGEVTVHGFRSSFRDWAEERGNQPREIAELCLAHDVGSAVERAYRRTDLLDRRRALMDRWAGFVISGKGTVVNFHAGT